MLVRFVSISILKWLFSFVVVFVAMQYLVPPSVIGTPRILVIWAMTALSALVFAEWAFKPKLPERRDVIMLMAVYLGVNVLLLVGAEIIAKGSPTLIIESWDIQVQYVLELAMVPLAAMVARKRRLKAAASEGLAS